MEQNNEIKKDLSIASPEELAAEIVNILYTKNASRYRSDGDRRLLYHRDR